MNIKGASGVKTILAILAVVTAIILTGCSDASVASSNLSKAADQFEIDRRIVFYSIMV